MTLTRARLRGGIDLGGTKIQAVVIDGRNAVRGKARIPTPRTAARRPWRRRWPRPCATRWRWRAPSPGAARSRSGVGAPGAIDLKAGDVSRSGNLPDWRTRSRSARRSPPTLGVPVGSATTSMSPSRPSSGSAPARATARCSASSGGPASAAASCSTASAGGPRCVGEIGHVVVQFGGLPCPCGRRGLHRGLRRTRQDGARARARAPTGPHDGAVRDHGATRQRPPRERRLGGGAGGGRPPRGELIDEAMAALGAGVASANNLLDVEAIILGGGLGTALRPAAAPTAWRARWRRTCSSRSVPRRCWSPRWATSAARSAPRWARRPARADGAASRSRTTLRARPTRLRA